MNSVWASSVSLAPAMTPELTGFISAYRAGPFVGLPANVRAIIWTDGWLCVTLLFAVVLMITNMIFIMVLISNTVLYLPP